MTDAFRFYWNRGPQRRVWISLQRTVPQFSAIGNNCAESRVDSPYTSALAEDSWRQKETARRSVEGKTEEMQLHGGKKKSRRTEVHFLCSSSRCSSVASATGTNEVDRLSSRDRPRFDILRVAIYREIIHIS